MALSAISLAMDLLMGGNATPPTEWWVSLHVYGSLDEVSAVSYSRKQFTPTTTTPEIYTNGNTIEWNPITEDWGLVTYCGIYTSQVGGTRLWLNSLESTINPGDGDTVTFDPETIQVTIV